MAAVQNTGGTSGLQVKALYDFDGDPSGGELTFAANDILTVIRQDVGEGWWEARHANGTQGLIPEAYVEVTSYSEPSIPPPPPPAAVIPSQPIPSQPTRPAIPSSWQPPPSNPPQQPVQGTLQSQGSYEDWDDDWDDDDSSTTTETPDMGGQVQPGGNKDIRRHGSSSDANKGYGSVRKPFSRFSKFSKDGGEAFLFGPPPTISESEKAGVIQEAHDGPAWIPHGDSFECRVDSPKKESKFHGMKSFIAYQLIPSFSGIQVSRRYKHFDWLHERLVEKFPALVIPPLPDKQVTGRYEEEFIQERMRQLRQWIERMCKHPVVARSDVFNHFLTCTDEKKWKQGKRKAEKDEYQGIKFFHTIGAPSSPLDPKNVEQKLVNHEKFVKGMDDSVRGGLGVMESNMKKHYGPYRKEYQKIGTSLQNLAKSFDYDQRPAAQGLTVAIRHTGETYNDIGKMFEDQPKHDIVPLIEGLAEYKGLLSTFPDILHVHKAALAKVAEAQTKMGDSETQQAQMRSDVISYTVLAEMAHFNDHRVGDFKQYMQTYLKGQIDFYKKITGKLEETLSQYDNA